MEFVLWFGVTLAAVALAGNHFFEVALVAAAVQLLTAVVSVFFSGRRRFPSW